MPTRVIDVGDGHTGRLLLADKDEISQRSSYVALSHCWGNLPEGESDKWNTTTRNKEKRLNGFLITELPQTFQDAIAVTQELGQRYLWIDSLCILQDDPDDWVTESKKMEAVFQNAYCVIAATSAEDSTKGFLNQPKEKGLQYVMVPESSQGKVCICTSVDDDFDSDVIKGVLNTRAWVLQERALSRRMIHFTNRQMYWECGGGVRCETLVHRKNSKLSFRSDPEFPRSIKNRAPSAQVELLQSLITDYSNFGISKKTDRPVAIFALAEALARTLKTKVYYGIFECFLHRCLLWQRAQNTLTQISYASKAPPSWSWMAYNGQIQYLPIEFEDAEWDDSVRLVEDEPSDPTASSEKYIYALEARVRRLRAKPEVAKRAILDKKNNEEVGDLWFDTEPEVQCAIIGRESTRATNRTIGSERIGAKDENRIYYVLFVTEYATQSLGRKFGRVGVGSIEKRFILFDSQDNLAHIV
ncbi:hypothetical protein BP6252_11688 [Coleophoma cylindrospora]|uniref:Heterokaryon incompatibility domain-containing protein n=1 Tax=Coleophoma cylindrospora TaxID=1849047 RepID=A0A3D8QKB8_9HELO|nr:hypothetical protein BP6252_11688 [Coleophoma cylindrospora]